MYGKYLTIAEAYYQAMAKKDAAKMAEFFQPTMRFKGPLYTLNGKESIAEGTKGLVQMYDRLSIRAAFESGNQVMMVYDLIMPTPSKGLNVAALLTFEDGLIAELELFYDASALKAQMQTAS